MTAAWTTPRTWVDGEVPTAAIMNTHVRDNVEFLEKYLVSDFERIDVINRQSSVSGIPNVASVETALFSYEVPADTLFEDLVGLRVSFAGRLADNATGKRIVLRWGPLGGPSAEQPLDTGVNLTFGGNFKGRAWITRTGVGAQYCFGEMRVGVTEPAAQFQVSDRAFGSQDETAAVLVQLTGFSIGNAYIHGHRFLVELVRAPASS